MRKPEAGCLSEERLLACAAGSTDDPGRRAAESHLADCAACRDAVRRIAAALDGRAPGAPPGLAERILGSMPADTRGAARPPGPNGVAAPAPPRGIHPLRRFAMAAAATLVASLGLSLFLTSVAPPKAEAAKSTPGELRVLEDGKFTGVCPLERTEVKAQVSGFLARVEVTQRFGNPYAKKIEAVYVFPLPQDSAVDDMEMRVGKRTIRGEIKRREVARRVYERAKAQGKVASLLDQERPNIFTQSVANILPGERVDVTIRYTETLPYKDGDYVFVFPMVVAPRYNPGSQTNSRSNEGTAVSTDRVPDGAKISPPVAPEGTRSGHDIAISVDLDAGVPLRGLSSETHRIDVDLVSPSRRVVTLGAGDTIPNKDFVLRYGVAGDRITDAILVHRNPVAGRGHSVGAGLKPAPTTRAPTHGPEPAPATVAVAAEPPAMDGGFFTLILQPPKRPAPGDVSPKELIFVIDSSGSMRGLPIEKAKEAMQLSIEGMNEEDTFNLVAFSNTMGQAFERPVPNTPANRRRALAFLDGLEGSGGTEMLPAIRSALEPAADPKRLRVVCFMTDGQIGNDMEILDAVRKTRDRSRVFPFGIGSAPNRFLLEGMAREGRGDCQFVSLDSDAKAAARKFAERTRNPVLTDVSIDWGGLEVADVYPREIPDVFAAGPVVLKGRYKKAGKGEVAIRGKAGGKPYERKIPVAFPESEPRNPTLPSLWARERISDLTARDWMGLQTGETRPDLKEAVTAVALEFRLMSPFTSFVAVEEASKTGTVAPARADVHAEMPEGQSYEGTLGTPPPAAGIAAATPAAPAVPPATAIAPAPAGATGPAPIRVEDKLAFEISDHMETSEARGDEASVSNLPLGGIGIADVMGVGGGGTGRFGHRTGGGRRNLTRMGGGSPGSENAVELGLQWLADHQEADGHWDCAKFGGKKLPAHDAAVTGLATLAFLGAGYTENAVSGGTPRQVEFAGKVKLSLDWMQKQQGADGSFSKNNYAHGMCALAAAEAHGMTGKRKEMAQRAVDCVVSRQKPGGGWDYGDQGEPGRDRCDTSITCWQVMALKSAKLSELNVPQAAFDNVLKYLRAAGNVSDSAATGEVAYEIAGGKASKGGPAVTAMAMLSCQFLGFPRDNPFIVAGANLLRERGPGIGGTFNLYAAYYGTMAMFQMGDKHFSPWNAAMRDPLVASQAKEAGDTRGSWPPEKDAYGKDGGRVYTTAMACLCLEVYYRYLPVYSRQ